MRKTAVRSCGFSRRRSKNSWPRLWARTKRTSGYRPVTWMSWFAVPSVTVRVSTLTTITTTGCRRSLNEDYGTAGSSMIRVFRRWLPFGGTSIRISLRCTTTPHPLSRHHIRSQDTLLEHPSIPGLWDQSTVTDQSITSLLITIEERATTCTLYSWCEGRTARSPLQCS